MKVVERASLKTLNTFGVEAAAGLLVTIESEEDVLELPPFEPDRDLVLGGGSNLLLAGEVPGTVYHVAIPGREEVGGDGDTVRVEVGAGEDWHALVLWSLERGYSGLENLSLIPGRAGAAPIQNIGAYGVELSTALESVTAWDRQTGGWARLDRDACRFGYRDSIFKGTGAGRYLVTSIRLALSRRFQPVLSYAGLADELAAAGVSRPGPGDVSAAVIRLRRRRLPDPAVIGNAGSFFKNPVVPQDVSERLLRQYPGLPSWTADPGLRKLSAAWMIERCGLKGCRDGDAGVSGQHALVLVNHGSATGAELLRLARRVQAEVFDRFGVALEPEPRIVEFTA